MYCMYSLNYMYEKILIHLKPFNKTFPAYFISGVVFGKLHKFKGAVKINFRFFYDFTAVYFPVNLILIWGDSSSRSRIRVYTCSLTLSLDCLWGDSY